ncbi:hypothetical protein CPLU01_07379 [Colletotrichum plurivorum]|uniref:Uncharacterized protein n=1 Tax=Colletotrichum plurivorum TaxID=2175906 RepID=A0A8H6KGA0_9PEZI|nr:hypothetical protein CPLU01_07379 [Colletotrichum plurivorum]
MLVSLLAVAFSLITFAATQEATCYAPNGDIADNKTCVPCNKLGINQQGIYSSCCALEGQHETRQTCLTSGLCEDSSGQLYRGFCTDRTWRSKACTSICMGDESSGDASNSAFLTSCENTNRPAYCCGRLNSTCCGTDDQIYFEGVESPCTSDSVGGSDGESDPKRVKYVTIGLAVAVAIIVLVEAISAQWLWRQNRWLKAQAAERWEIDLFVDRHAAEHLVENTQGMHDNSDPASDNGFASGRNESREMNGAR